MSFVPGFTSHYGDPRRSVAFISNGDNPGRSITPGRQSQHLHKRQSMWARLSTAVDFTQGIGAHDPAQSGWRTTLSAPLQRTGSYDSFQSDNEDFGEQAEPPSNEHDENDRAEARVKRLAKAYSVILPKGQNLFNVSEDSMLNPQSDSFRARPWIKAMMKLREQTNSAKDSSAGICFRNLTVYGYRAPIDFQKTVANLPLQLVALAQTWIGRKKRIDILQSFEGLVDAGEMLLVLGPPGSGCSTFLKTLAGEMQGINVEKGSYLSYQGIGHEQMHDYFHGERIYTAEQDIHFPTLTVAETLLFAALAKAPQTLPDGVSPKQYAEHLRDAMMAIYDIRHTANTKVGNDYIRGISGGERKRVTIAEAALSGAHLQCWDNSTRGLDSANAIRFCKTLKLSSELMGSISAVAIYQTPQPAYEVFSKVILLYEGRQIYFGPTRDAVVYFEEMGFVCPDHQTDADFLTSITSPQERLVRRGWESLVPGTSYEFAKRWHESETRQKLVLDIEEFEQTHAIGGQSLKALQEYRRKQSKWMRLASPYTISYWSQIKLCLWRNFRLVASAPSLPIVRLLSTLIVAMIMSSLYYNLASDSSGLRTRGSLIFYIILRNGFAPAVETLTLYVQRPIVEKHSRYAFYHPSAEAFASMLTDLPINIVDTIVANLILYFMTNLRREPGPFFFFLLTAFLTMMAMSMLFRTIASYTRSLVQALVPTTILVVALMIYMGFVIPINQMLGWARWINYLDPLAYGFESLMINEYSGRSYTCTQFIPPSPQFGNGKNTNQVCSSLGSVAGQPYVNGDAYLRIAYGYTSTHKWRNIGLLFVFIFGLLICHLLGTEFDSARKPKGEVLLFSHSNKPKSVTIEDDIESGIITIGRTDSEKQVPSTSRHIPVYQWKDICYSVMNQDGEQRILDHTDGWVKPGTMTALMGVSGAGKTTLLDVLAARTTMGVVRGEMLVDGRPRDKSFQRKTGYVQQNDIHLGTSTVREALVFSGLLRQPAQTSEAEVLSHVDEVIRLLEMEGYADAVVGIPGQGLNIEQRKRLTIGVELAAKPQLLFLDEPTSGLDAQTSWSILNLMRKLTNNGQAILCTIHQPSAMLFQCFDSLLFLAKGGKTVYFGPIGQNCSIMMDYFKRNGATFCQPGTNPAEWMLKTVTSKKNNIDWPEVWQNSLEIHDVHAELERLKMERLTARDGYLDMEKEAHNEFAASFSTQMRIVLRRVFEQYWRSPSYVYSKIVLCAAVGLLIGFSFFKAPNSLQGIQNQLFGIFMLLTVFAQLVQQLMPNFVVQRELYEARERPSRTYSWKVFMLSNIIADIPYSLIAGTVLFFCWYYPVGLWRNALLTNNVAERGALCLLLILAVQVYGSTFAFMITAGMETSQTAGAVANLIFAIALTFCGVLVSPKAMPVIWRYTIYYASPFHYLVDGLFVNAIGSSSVKCASGEYLHVDPPINQTCDDYLGLYFDSTQTGYLLNPDAISNCQLCPLSNTNTFLSSAGLSYNNRWRDFGIVFLYIAFNVVAALWIYWFFRVPRKEKIAKDEQSPHSSIRRSTSIDQPSVCLSNI